MFEIKTEQHSVAAKGSDHNFTIFFQLELIKIARTHLPPLYLNGENEVAQDDMYFLETSIYVK